MNAKVDGGVALLRESLISNGQAQPSASSYRKTWPGSNSR